MKELISSNYLVSIPVLIASFMGLLNLYFAVARRFDLVDIPNKRSSHDKPTIVGAGLIFYLAVLFYFIIDPSVLYFFLGATAIAVVGFLDDRIQLSSSLRMLIQLLATVLMLYQLDVVSQLEWWHWIGTCILVVGTLNAYNFMDGINGITGLYSLVALITFLYLALEYNYNELIIVVVSAVLAFLFYNLRKKAVCFSGDVGSLSIAIVILFLLLHHMLKTERWESILLLAVYGVDSVMTIVYRIGKRENIFKAHRSHIYQLLVHQLKWSHLKVSMIYAVLQLLVNVIYIALTDSAPELVYGTTIALLMALGAVSLVLRKRLNAITVHS